MDISIVSGTYNRLPYLQKMVISVRQSLAAIYGLEYEIVLVDGGSNDTTQEWCKLQPDIKLIEHGELKGAVAAFNDGAFAASGRYVIMANDDIEFVGDSIWIAYCYMETHPTCGGGCFWQDRNERDWHVEGMPAVEVVGKNRGKQIHVSYAQVGIFPKWLGDTVSWWCDERQFAPRPAGYLTENDIREINDKQLGLHTYGGDNELSARIWDLGYTVDPITPTEPRAKITDREADDELRRTNNIISGAKDPRSVRGHHPDSWKWGRKWFRRNEQLGYRNLAGPILKERPMITNPDPSPGKERVLYLPLFEQGWTVQKEQKRGLRDALSRRALVYEFDYMAKFNSLGKERMLAELHQVCDDFRPTVFLAQLHNSDQINAADLDIIKRICGGNCRFVNWNGDYWPDQLLDEKGLALAKAFHLMTTVNLNVMEAHQARGINTRYWQIGWEPLGRGYKPEVRYDVVFLASGYSKARQELGRFLSRQSFSFGLYGHGWPEGMAKGECLYNFIEACKLYSGAKLAIGDSQWPESGFVSNRIFQILAAGGCALCHQWFRDYEALGLINNVNCIIWQDQADLGRLLKYWLAPVNADRLKEIAAAGEQLALERHSFDNRVDELWLMLGINMYQDEVWRW